VVESEEVVDVLAFKTSWIKTELRANREDLFLIFMVGDSMEPTLRPGDIILIDKRENPIHRDGVYVFRMGESLQVKRLQCFPDKTIEATADNSVYKSFKIEPEKMAESFRVIGRVVWAGRRM
jgi:phage repressor protein C with HTH and peptisase S24 domain